MISLLNLGLAPRASGLEVIGEEVSESFNSRLLDQLRSQPSPRDTLWVDSFALFNDIARNPSAYGFSNVTDPAAPMADEDIPSPLPPRNSG